MDFLKEIFGINQSAAGIDAALLVLRVVIGFMMLLAIKRSFTVNFMNTTF